MYVDGDHEYEVEWDGDKAGDDNHDAHVFWFFTM